MAVEVHREPPELFREFRVYERCAVCQERTAHWHGPTSTPCCEPCAAKTSLASLAEAKKGGE